MSNQKTEKLGLKKSLSYGMGAIGEGIGYNFFYSYFIFFMINIAGVNPAVAGTVSLIAVFWDAVTDPIIGSMSDRCRSKRGRRTPFIKYGSIFLGISLALMFINIDLPAGAKVVYYILINIAYWTFLTSAVIPHIALGSELTGDFEERTTLRTCANFLMNIGMLIAISGSLMIVQFFTKIFGSESLGWTATGVLFAVIIVFVYNFCCFSVRNFEPENPNLAEGYVPEKLSLSSVFSSYLQALKVKPFNKLLIITFCVNFAVGVGSSLMIFLYTYVFRYSENKTSFMLLITTLFLLLTTVLAGVFANKFGKKQMMIGGMICYTACYLIMAVLPAGDFTAYLYILFYGIGNATYWTLIYSMSYDTALIEKFKSGNSPDGLYTSMIGFFMKAGSAIGMWITGIVLSAIGFNAEAAEQAADTIANLKLAFGIIPAVILAVAVIAAIAYSLTKEKYALLLTAAEAKENGVEYRVEGLERVL